MDLLGDSVLYDSYSSWFKIYSKVMLNCSNTVKRRIYVAGTEILRKYCFEFTYDDLSELMDALSNLSSQAYIEWKGPNLHEKILAESMKFIEHEYHGIYIEYIKEILGENTDSQTYILDILGPYIDNYTSHYCLCFRCACFYSDILSLITQYLFRNFDPQELHLSKRNFIIPTINFLFSVISADTSYFISIPSFKPTSENLVDYLCTYFKMFLSGDFIVNINLCKKYVRLLMKINVKEDHPELYTFLKSISFFIKMLFIRTDQTVISNYQDLACMESLFKTLFKYIFLSEWTYNVNETYLNLFEIFQKITNHTYILSPDKYIDLLTVYKNNCIRCYDKFFAFWYFRENLLNYSLQIEPSVYWNEKSESLFHLFISILVPMFQQPDKLSPLGNFDQTISYFSFLFLRYLVDDPIRSLSYKSSCQQDFDCLYAALFYFQAKTCRTMSLSLYTVTHLQIVIRQLYYSSRVKARIIHREGFLQLAASFSYYALKVNNPRIYPILLKYMMVNQSNHNYWTCSFPKIWEFLKKSCFAMILFLFDHHFRLTDLEIYIIQQISSFLYIQNG